MIEPYNAVGLIPSFWGIRQREDMAKNLEHIESLTMLPSGCLTSTSRSA